MYALAMWTVGMACLGVSLGIFLAKVSERRTEEAGEDGNRSFTSERRSR